MFKHNSRQILRRVSPLLQNSQNLQQSRNYQPEIIEKMQIQSAALSSSLSSSFFSSSSSTTPVHSTTTTTTATTIGTAKSMVAQNLLSDKTYDIEFNGYLSNHAKHAIVALDKLGASEERIQEYWDNYTTLTPYNLELHKVETPREDGTSFDTTTTSTGTNRIITSTEDWENFRGKKMHWQEMVKFLEHQTSTSTSTLTSTEDLVKTFAPDLLPGIAGALTHGIIHLGWGIDAGNPWMTMEGLAYLNFCYLPLVPPLQEEEGEEGENDGIVATAAGGGGGGGGDGPISSALHIAKEWEKHDLTNTWIEPVKKKYDESFHSELVPAGFQWQLAKVLHDAHPIATRVPKWFSTKPLDQLWEEMYRFVVTVYLGTRTTHSNSSNKTEQEFIGNFVVLHTISSLWALEQVCNVINDEETTRKALKYFWATGICILGTSSIGFPSPKVLEATVQQFGGEAASTAATTPTNNKDFSKDDDDDFDWDPIVQRGCAEIEEHNIKLVYVCKSLWERYGQWKGFSEAAKSFTVTPNIGPQNQRFE